MSQLLNNITSKDLSEWMAYLEVEDDIEKERASQAKAQKAKNGEALLKAKITQAGHLAAAGKKRKYGKDGKKR